MTVVRVAMVVVVVLAMAAGWRLGMGGPGLAQEATPVPGVDAAATAHLGGRLPGDPQIALVQVAAGLDDPVAVAVPADGSGRIFVAQRAGQVRVVNPDGTVRERPLLDLTGRVVSGQSGEQGLLGLAVAPDFKTSGKLYVDWNDTDVNGDVAISEFQLSARDPNVADPTSERAILRIPKPFPAHSGGTIKFGPDGDLYIAVGDGGWQGDPYDNAQSRFTLLGKILRIDVHGDSPGQPYRIPPDNPFAGPDRYDNPYPGQAPRVAASSSATPEATTATGQAEGQAKGKAQSPAKGKNAPARGTNRAARTVGHLSPENRIMRPPVREEIWALGFRNPWQFAFDPQTGDFYVGDVGGSAWEEIDFQPAGSPAGQNYGWDWLEGTHCFPETLASCPRQQVGVLPVAEYAHGADGCAVVGIGVARGPASPSLDGIYFSGDFCTGKIRGLERDASGQWVFQDLLDTALLITSSGQDAAGNLYVTARSQTQRHTARPENSDALWKIVEADQVPPGATTAPLGGGNEEAAGAAVEGEAAGTPAAVEPTRAAAGAVGTPSGKVDQKRTVTIDAADVYFEPKKVQIRANLPVTLTLVNTGAMLHNFSIDELHVSVDLPPGARQTITINAPPGHYRFYCNVPGHREDGMVGNLIAG